MQVPRRRNKSDYALWSSSIPIGRRGTQSKKAGPSKEVVLMSLGDNEIWDNGIPTHTVLALGGQFQDEQRSDVNEKVKEGLETLHRGPKTGQTKFWWSPARDYCLSNAFSVKAVVSMSINQSEWSVTYDSLQKGMDRNNDIDCNKEFLAYHAFFYIPLSKHN